MKKYFGLLMSLAVMFVVSLMTSGSAHATAAYDAIVTAADVTGLATTQVTLLVGMIGFVVVSVAYAIISNTLKKGKGRIEVIQVCFRK